MARWRLTEAHYLKVKGTLWEYTELDRTTGRPKRVQFEVPLYLNPMDADDLKQYGQVDPIVGYDADPIVVVIDDENSRHNTRDVFYVGKPTPGMLPLDDAAREISAAMSKGAWDPTTGIDPDAQSQSFSNRLMLGLIDKMTDMKTEAQAVPQAAGLQDLLTSMAAMLAKQTEILAAMSAPGRRV